MASNYPSEEKAQTLREALQAEGREVVLLRCDITGLGQFGLNNYPTAKAGLHGFTTALPRRWHARVSP